MSMVGFPLLLIPLAVYNIIAFLMPSVSFGDTLFKLPLVSGAQWPVTLSDILLTLGVLLLLLEVIKAARPGAKYLTDHLLSLVVFGCAGAEFVMWPKFGTSTYFLLTLLSMTDFLTGIALRTRRAGPVARNPAPAQRQAPQPAPEAVPAHEAAPAPEAAPQPEPAAAAEDLAPAHAAEPVPEPSPPPTAAPDVAGSAPAAAPEAIAPAHSAASVAESVLLDHPAPKSSQPAAATPERPTAAAGSDVSPSVASPEPPSGGHAAVPPQPPRD